MTTEQKIILQLIKALRAAVNDTPTDPTLWANRVCFHLDAAADEIEFPKSTGEKS